MSYALFDRDYIYRGLHQKYLDDGQNNGGILVGIVYFLQIPISWILSMISLLPIISVIYEITARCWSRGIVGFYLRGTYWKPRIFHMGQNCFIDTGVTIMGAENIIMGHDIHIDERVSLLCIEGELIIGNFFHIASNSLLQGKGGITIGEYCAVGFNSALYSSSNFYQDEYGNPTSSSAMASHKMQSIKKGRVEMKDYSVVTVGCTVLPGVTIGRRSFVGTNSVINKNIPDNVLAIGSPARIIKEI